MCFFRFIMLIIFIITIYIISDFITCLFFGGPDVIEKIFKNPKFKKVISIILFVIAVFFLCSCILYKVNAADGTDPTIYELSGKQYRAIISLLTVIAFSSISSCVIALTRKG